MAVLKGLFGGWHDGVRRVLDTLREEEILRHDLYDLDPPLPTYVRDNVARCLLDASDVRAGLAAYDQARRRPTQRLVRMARTVGRLAHARRLTPVRDAAVRVALCFGPPA